MSENDNKELPPDDEDKGNLALEQMLDVRGEGREKYDALPYRDRLSILVHICRTIGDSRDVPFRKMIYGLFGLKDDAHNHLYLSGLFELQQDRGEVEHLMEKLERYRALLEKIGRENPDIDVIAMAKDDGE